MDILIVFINNPLSSLRSHIVRVQIPHTFSIWVRLLCWWHLVTFMQVILCLIATCVWQNIQFVVIACTTGSFGWVCCFLPNISRLR